ncbi:MAG: glutamate-1-semialdehyde 2,1-aminomutase [Anaerolineales bacterium]
MLTLTQSNYHFKKASNVLPLGVSSNYRYWGEEDTRYIARGKGAHLWDVDGNRYIDYRLGYGPAILGHADDRVDTAVAQSLQWGTTFAMSIPEETEVAKKIVAMCPGVEMVRFANSGTEATMHALRLARAFTGREKFIMFEGQYHGLHDSVMFAANIGGDGYWSSNRRSPVAFPISSGIPHFHQQLVYMLPFNDCELLERTIEQSWGEIAAVLVEPVLGNCGGILPEPEFLPAIRRLCDEYGIVMIMDEVKTGFRLARGGAQEVFNVTPDLATYAKAMGNGYPVAAFGGKREIMEQVGQGICHGGTFSGNRLSMAAANTTLDILQNTDALARVRQNGEKLQTAMGEVLSNYDLDFCFSGHPSMFSFMFTEKPPKEYREWKNTDTWLYEEVAAGMIRRGVMMERDSREPMFLCAALTAEDIAETANILEDSLKEALEQM